MFETDVNYLWNWKMNRNLISRTGTISAQLAQRCWPGVSWPKHVWPTGHWAGPGVAPSLLGTLERARERVWLRRRTLGSRLGVDRGGAPTAKRR
jgi:hypothetical protein